ncbi:putative Zn-dependent protease [Humitalea rosea]|uniref:Putative Zn-dependent protease n=1 Tax=Humitalea rosea TaxID=990373 RepID=A0A2W7JAA3_9PROT|nr:M48 family metalloprotease [Humitalea rosea]PZW48372.1 putative Zn-dependent protease [Humitalea rosea]
MNRLALCFAALMLMVSALYPQAATAQGTSRVTTIRDAETESLLRTFADPLFRAAGVSPSAVRITLIQDAAINAFVATGNRMFIHTGLIQKAEGAEELLGVLAHETGHIAGGHLARLPEEMRLAMLRSVAAMLLGGVAAAGGGADAGMAIALGGTQMAQGSLYAFTRQQEQAADQAGVSYLERNGWSPRGLTVLLQRLLDQELLAVGRQDPYFRTHPLSRDRLEYVQEELARSPTKDAGIPAEWHQRYAMVRAKLDGFLAAPAVTRRRYPASDTSAPARYARAIADFRAGRIDAAVVALDQLIAEDPRSPWLQEMKGQVLFEGGRPVQALDPYRAAIRMAPGAALIRLSMARVMIETGDPLLLRPAVTELESALATERDNAFAWRQLGIAYGRQGQMPQADLALAEEALLEGDYPQVRWLATRAEAALPPGPTRLRAQDLRNAAQRDNMTRDERDADDAARRRQGIPRR